MNASCPSGCHCQLENLAPTQVSVDCGGAGLAAIPDSLPEGVTTLNVSGNQVSGGISVSGNQVSGGISVSGVWKPGQWGLKFSGNQASGVSVSLEVRSVGSVQPVQCMTTLRLF